MESRRSGPDTVTAVIGDVVGSRAAADQPRLLRGVGDRLTALRHAARTPGMTVGDEFQAVYRRPGLAVWDVARLRLELLVDPPSGAPVELRVGFGVGPIAAGDDAGAAAPGQSGPGWWHARAALDEATRARRAWPEVRWWVEGEADDIPALRAVLIGLDTLAARFDDVDRRLALGLLDGGTASALAEVVDMTRQSVDARLHEHGVYGWIRALEQLAGAPASTGGPADAAGTSGAAGTA